MTWRPQGAQRKVLAGTLAGGKGRERWGPGQEAPHEPEETVGSDLTNFDQWEEESRGVTDLDSGSELNLVFNHFESHEMQ